MKNKKRNPIPYIKEVFITSPRSGRTIALSALILLLLKQIVVYVIYGSQLQWPTIFHTFFHFLWFVASDFIVFGIILFFVFVNLIFKIRRLKILSNSISLILLLFFLIDVITIYYFQSRLSIFDLSSFITISNGWSFFLYIVAVVAVFLVTVTTIFVFVQRHFKWTKNRNKQMVIAVRFFIFSLFFSFINFIFQKNRDLQENILLLNIDAIDNRIGGDRDFFSANDPLAKKYEDYFTSIQGQNKKLNVILVFAESFSTVDSKRVWGIYNNYPLFDKVQAEGITFKNFMANGCTSETAHIALLQWVEPWQNPLEKIVDSYYNYANYTDALPTFFNNLWYDTTFLSTVTLDFLNQRDFIKSVKFQHIIGEEAFKEEKKYVFDAAPDNVLYNKALQVIASWDAKKPFFLAMQTVSSHRPYNTPYGKSEEDMFTYVDRNMYAFYLKLKATWFFKNGMLIVVGDHRKMEAIPTDEFKKYGMTSHSRALATIIGSGIKANQRDENIIQHTDIFYSLKYLFGSGKVLVWKDFNNIFKPSQEDRNRGVRYCRFSEKNYAVIKDDWTAHTLRPGQDPYIQKYITAYKKFEYQKLVGTGYDSLYFNNFIIWTGKSYDFSIIAHRGDPSEADDNSLKWFKLAKENESDGVEFDVSFTKDGYNVIYHWPSLNNTTCGKNKYVYNYTLKDLQKKCKLKDGETIMTLEEMLVQTQWWFGKYFVEIKVHDPTKAEAQALDAINIVTRHWMQGKVVFTSYDKTANYIIWSYKWINAWWDTFSTWSVSIIWKFPHQYFLIPQNLVSEEIVKTAEMLNKKVVVYTVNTEEDFDRIYNMDIRTIMTDNVPLIKEVLKKYSVPTPVTNLLEKSK